jgi:hypothetical protein
MMVHAYCYGCGYSMPLKIGSKKFALPRHWLQLKTPIWNGHISPVYYCSHACVFAAKRRGYTFPEPVTERPIHVLDGGTVVSLKYAI